MVFSMDWNDDTSPCTPTIIMLSRPKSSNDSGLQYVHEVASVQLALSVARPEKVRDIITCKKAFVEA